MTLSERLARIYLGRKHSGASSKKEKMSGRDKSTPIQTPTIYSEIEDDKSDSVLMSSQSEVSSVRSVTPKTSLEQSLRTIPQDSFVTDGRSRTKWEKKNEQVKNEHSDATTSALANLGESLSSFCNSNVFADVTIRIGSQTFDAHRIVLASQSSTFRNMLVERPLNKRGKIDIDMEVSSHDAAKEFPNLLKYMYGGGLTLNRSSAPGLLTLAVKLDISSIKSLCDRLILDLIEDADLNDALKWLEFSAKNGLDDLAIKCVDGVIADFAQELMSSSGTEKLSKQAMVQLVRSSTLLVPSEWFVFQMTEKWLLEQEKTSDDILSTIDDVLDQIRFYQMSGKELLQVEESVLGSRYSTTVQVYLNQAYRYQIIASARPPDSCSTCQPRDYTDTCTQIFYHPRTRAKAAESVQSSCGKWEVTPRKYYDTLNVVVVLKCRIGWDARVWISIVIFDRHGRPAMRLRRRPFQIRDPLRSMSTTLDAELFAIDNILNQDDYQAAITHTGSNGLQIGMILRVEPLSFEEPN